MRHVAAYLLALMSGKEVTSSSIKDILGSVGVEADEKQLDVLLNKFSGKNVEELISLGGTMLSSMPAGGMAAAGSGAPAAAAGGGGAAPAAEEKKEEKKEEPEEESDDDMGFGLFD